MNKDLSLRNTAQQSYSVCFYVYNNMVYRYAPDGIVCVEGLSVACQVDFPHMLI